MDVGLHIKERRKTLKVSQGDLSEMAGVSKNTMYKIEKGLANPTLGTLSKIADILGMEVCLRIKNIETVE